MVDELLWKAVKSHTVKGWGKGDGAKSATSCLGRGWIVPRLGCEEFPDLQLGMYWSKLDESE